MNEVLTKTKGLMTTHTMTPQNKLSSVAKATPSVIALAIRHPVIQEYTWMITILTSILLLVI